MGIDEVTVVGIGADGWFGLSGPARLAIGGADVLFGNSRQLALVRSELHDGGRPKLVGWPSPLLEHLEPLLDEHAGQRRCVLASGDPMFYGIGTTLVRLLGADRVKVISAPSSLSLVCARLGWASEQVTVVSTVGRPVSALNSALGNGRQIVVLSADETTPAAVIALLREAGYGDSEVSIAEQLGGRAERVRTAVASQWGSDCEDVNALNLIAIRCVAEPSASHLSSVVGLPDDAYLHDGQLTKREVRAVTLSSLAPRPGELLWDVGAGSGSIAIEWLRSDPSCTAICIERDEVRAQRIETNADRLGVPRLQLVTGTAPDAFAGLAKPDAVFIGGGVTVPGVIEQCLQALPSGGRLVANAVTVESEAVIAGAYAEHGGTLTRIEISRTAAVGTFTGWQPAMPVTQWVVVKR